MRGEEENRISEWFNEAAVGLCLDLISKDKFYKVTVPFERGIDSGVIFYNSVQNLEHAK